MPYLILIYAGGIAVTAGLAVASGILAKVFYLACCVALSVWSSRRNHWDYLLLTLWIAALTPFARRLVDLEAGWDATNIMLTAQFLVAAPMIPSILQRIRTLDAGAALFPSVAALCILYGLVITLLRGNLAPGLLGLADWGVPVLYYFFIVTHRDSVPALLQRLPSFVTANLLLLGSYGIWQFIDPPLWDRLWMQNADVPAFGLPEPFMVRVFSTMNSAGPFSYWVMVLIILSFGFTTWLTPIARAMGLLSLVFTVVRTSWGGLGLALLIIVLSSGRRAAKYALGTVVAVVAASAVVTTVPQIEEMVSTRLASFSDLQQDGSLLEREDISSRLLTLIMANPLGVGIGILGRGALAADAEQVVFTGPVDNGVLEIFGSLGWFFGAVYCAAVAATAARAAGCAHRFAQQRKVTFAASIACLMALPITNIAAGVTGVVLWLMLGMTVAMEEEKTAREEASTATRRATSTPFNWEPS
ncbi:MAG: O-antigen ligase family protein [Stellaceae bacterium]